MAEKEDKIPFMEPTVFLFDVDGVLVRPGGYRAALRDAFNHFAGRMGLGPIAPEDETVGIFEAQGITCEWDMLPLLLAITMEDALKAALKAAENGSGVKRSFSTFAAACDWLSAHPQPELAIDFAPRLRELGRFVQVGQAPSDSILAVCRANPADGVFPHLAGQGALAELLSNTRWLSRSATTQVFEAFAVGDEYFTRACGLPAPLRSESLLALYDEPLLAPALRDRLLALREAGGLGMAAYTARPSLPVGQPTELLSVYVPEAEMALERVGIPDLPLMGSGQMGEAARCLGEKEDRLVKPAPYHAVAAIAAAWTGSRRAALDWMEQVFCFFERNGRCEETRQPALDTAAGPLPHELHLHIFEDSPSGMQGGEQAARMLAELGMKVHLHLWGISTHAEKSAVLHALGAQVFADVNLAVEAALSNRTAS